jgi:hypothetical protein
MTSKSKAALEAMSVPAKSSRMEKALYGTLRVYWREINRYDRQTAAWQREKQKARDKKRRKCRCQAYPWPHRPGGGFCRYPDPPERRWQPKPGGRPYRKRYAGILRQIARANGLHPIRDRAAIDAMMPRVLAQAKRLHRQRPQLKFRNMEVTETEVTGNWSSAGPTM